MSEIFAIYLHFVFLDIWIRKHVEIGWWKATRFYCVLIYQTGRNKAHSKACMRGMEMAYSWLFSKGSVFGIVGLLGVV